MSEFKEVIVTIFFIALVVSGSTWGSSAYYINSRGGKYLGCLYSEGYLWLSRFATLNPDECKKQGAQTTLTGWQGQPHDQGREFLKINDYATYYVDNPHDNTLHRELRENLDRLRDPHHKNGDHNCNHSDSYYGYLYLKYINGVFINITSIVKTDDYHSFNNPEEYLSEDYVSDSLIKLLDEQRKAFQNPISIGNYKIKLVSHDENEKNELSLHQDGCDYLGLYVTRAQLEGGELEIYLSNSLLGGTDEENGPIAQKFVVENSRLLKSMPCVEGVSYLIREGRSESRLGSDYITHRHNSWRNMQRRDVIITRYFIKNWGISR